MRAKVERFETLAQSMEQVDVVTEHVIHGGMYARTIRLDADIVIAGVHIVLPTLLVVHGDADVLIDDGWVAIRGYGVLPGSAGRKQVFVTRSAVEMTMVFPTQARTVEDAEREFTDEYEKLMSHKSVRDEVLITGE